MDPHDGGVGPEEAHGAELVHMEDAEMPHTEHNSTSLVVKVQANPSLVLSSSPENVAVCLQSEGADSDQKWDVRDVPHDDGNLRCFALFSEASGKALMVQDDAQQIELADFNEEDGRFLWLSGPSSEDGFQYVQSWSKRNLFLTAEHIMEGAVVSAGQWASSPQQMWAFERAKTLETTGSRTYPLAVATHEEIVANHELFNEALSKFHSEMGATLRVPQLGGRELDLHMLYKEVTGRGGLSQVIQDRKWREVTVPFNFPPTTTSASFVVRKLYINLLHHFEQAYFFRNTGTLVTPPPLTPFPRKRGKRRDTESSQADPLQNIGSTVTGTLRSKCEHGYLVNVVVGNETLSGILYHPPNQSGVPPLFMLSAVGVDSSSLGRKKRKKRRRLEMAAHGQILPKQNRTGYNFFFGEWRMKLKAELPEVPDREISRLIGQQWMSLTPEQKTPYQELATADRERYVREMKEFNRKVEEHETVDASIADEQQKALTFMHEAGGQQHAPHGHHDLHNLAGQASQSDASGEQKGLLASAQEQYEQAMHGFQQQHGQGFQHMVQGNDQGMGGERNHA